MKRKIILCIALMLIGAFNIPLAEGLNVTVQTHDTYFSCIVLDGEPPFIYVWQSSLDGDFGYYGNFTYDKLSNGLHVITVKVADSTTDTQIPAFNVTKEEIQSIRSNISVDMFDPNDCANPRVNKSDIYDYGPPYRCGDIADTCFYRLFEKNTTWVKVFTVTPMLEDKNWAWDWNWSRTSAPNDEVNVTLFIGGGCQRTSAFLFNYSENVTSFYVEPITDWVDVTIYDGMNPPVVYSPFQWYNVTFGINCSAFCKSKGYEIGCAPCPDGSGDTANIYCVDPVLPMSMCFRTQDSKCSAGLSPIPDTCMPLYSEQHCGCFDPRVVGRNLLPFPPADSLEDDNGTIFHFHPFEGARYSYFMIDHTIPENASYLHVEVNYTCETELWRNSSDCGLPLDEIKDKSTVYDNFTIKFLEHENPRDNCRWNNILEWRNISGVWNRTWNSDLGKHVLRLHNSSDTNRRMVSVAPIPETTILEFLVRGNASGGEIADTTIGFYSDVDAKRYWFLDLHEDATGELAIGYSDNGVSTVTESQALAAPYAYTDNAWYNVLIYLFVDDYGDIIILAKIWPNTVLEPHDWHINYTLNTSNGEAPYGNYAVIGTEGGSNNEDFLFDSNPKCGIDISGYYDVEKLVLGYAVVTEGFVEIKIEPDILSGITLSMGNKSRIDYQHVEHPAKHVLYRKEKPELAVFRDIWRFYYYDEYGYASRLFGFEEMCNLPPCPANCYCEEGDIFSPKCVDYNYDPPLMYLADDCVCAPSECYPDPCTSDRTYHEFEGIYYDFVEFYNDFLYKEENYFSVIKGVNYSSYVTADELFYVLDLSRANTPEGIYYFYFYGRNLTYNDFNESGRLTIYTHFRNFTYNLSDVLGQRYPSNISYDVSPAPEDIVEGDTVTVNLELTCATFPRPYSDVRVKVVNYETELIGVNMDGDGAYVTTDAAGKASFSFKIRQDMAEVILSYDGDIYCKPTEVIFFLSPGAVSSIITSVDFFLLIAIFILIIFSYRFFKKGRLDFYEMWQEFRGEKD